MSKNGTEPDRISQRIERLQMEYQQGAQSFRDLQGQVEELTARQAQVRQQMLRIEGAIAELHRLREGEPAPEASASRVEVKEGVRD